MSNTVKFSISDQACIDILTTAVESGSMYWLDEYGPVAHRDDRGYVQSLQLRKITGGGESDERARRRMIVPSHMADALGALITDQDVASRVLGNILGNLDRDGCGADAEACDCVLQKAVFRKVVYG